MNIRISQRDNDIVRILSGVQDVLDNPFITEIRTQLFCDIYTLKEVNLPNLTFLCEYMFADDFQDASILEKVNLPSITGAIGEYTFSGCTRLKEVHLGSGVTQIDSTAFNNCTQSNLTITIDKPSGSISGAPWGATNATIIWNG